MVSIVLNGTAAEDPSYHKNKSMMKNIEKAKLGYNTEVNKALISHLSDPNILKNLLEKQPDSPLRKTKDSNIILINSPLLSNRKNPSAASKRNIKRMKIN